MKKIFTCSLLMLSFFASAQDLPDDFLNAVETADIMMDDADEVVDETLSFAQNDDTFEEAAEKSGIAHRTFKDLPNVKSGYYAINAVLSKSKNLKKTISKLSKQGFGAGFIKHPITELHYVYLNHYGDWQVAIDAINSNFNDKYEEDVWIMHVDNGMVAEDAIVNQGPEINNDNQFEQTSSTNTDKVYENEPNTNIEIDETVITQEPTFNDAAQLEEQADVDVAVEEVTYDMLNDLKDNDPIPAISESSNKSKLLQKADAYFDKMWYAEAAELYEQSLKKGKGDYTIENIQKAADAYYFNTNMEKAYEWYNILYEKQGKDLSVENTFRYSHALKGTGKYARAKRLMRLYNKKMSRGEGDIADEDTTPNEMVLDNILAASPNFDIKNMAINSEYSDFSPMFLDSTDIVYASAKDSLVSNTRQYKWNNQPYLDLYVAKINEETQDLKDVFKFSKKINTKYHEASVAFSPDNSTMYFTRNNYGKKLKRDKNGVNHLKIYVSKKVDGEWTEAGEVPFNSDNYSTGHPALSPDGKKLYFVSDMPGSIGETDIFVVDVLENGQFSDPKNLGPDINTEQREMFPFVNEEKLYFSSDGHVGLGGLDVYEVSMDEEGAFLDVVNVGKPVNSNKDDFSYIVNEEKGKGFFASNRAGGKGDDDIYSFKRIAPEKVPENLNAIAGVVTELVTGDLMPKTMVELLDENGIKLKEMEAGEDGSFMFEDLDSNKKYILRTKKSEYFDSNIEVATKDNELINQDIVLRRLEEMIAVEEGIKKLKTEMIFFDFDKSYIRNDAAEELDKLVEVMTEYPNMVIKIESHTDSRGTAEYNKYLSDRRAKSTREYILSQGIDASRIQSATGYGEEMLLNECNGSVRCTEEQHFRNRRSEFIIVNM